MSIRFGLAAGPWRTLAEGRGGNSTGLADGIGIAFSNPYAKDGGVVISVAHTIADQEVPVVAVGKDDSEHCSGPSSAAGAANMSQITATFPNLAIRDVQTFRLQARPYQWVEFRNVCASTGAKGGRAGCRTRGVGACPSRLPALFSAR